MLRHPAIYHHCPRAHGTNSSASTMQPSRRQGVHIRRWFDAAGTGKSADKSRFVPDMAWRYGWRNHVANRGATVCRGPIFVRSAPTPWKAVLALGVWREHEAVGILLAGRRDRGRRGPLSRRHGARPGLAIRQMDCIRPNIAPSQVGHFTASATSERKQQAMNVCWRLHGQGATVVVA